MFFEKNVEFRNPIEMINQLCDSLFFKSFVAFIFQNNKYSFEKKIT